MSGPAVELQKGLFDKLRNDATLTALLGGSAKIYDSPPDGAVTPYVTIGDDTASDEGTKTYRGQQITATIHSWSQKKSRAEVKGIMDRIWSLLHEGTITISGHSLILMRFEFGNTELDPDDRTYHGIQRFRVLFKEG